MAKKRGNNDGTIRQRADGRWEARVTVGYQSNGKQLQKSLYGATQGEVQAKMKEVQVHLDKDMYVEPSDLTVQQWLNTWYDSYGCPRWRPSTAAGHKNSIRLHLIPALGRIRLSKLRPDHLQAFINTQSKKGLSPASVRKQIMPLQGALKQAVENGLLMRNVADSIKLPKLESKEIAYLTIEEQKRLIVVLPDDTRGRALRFIMGSGLRISELCGLRWSDIDRDSFTIRQGAQYVKLDGKQKLVIVPPKTKAGKRTIPLTSSMQELLDQQRKGQMSCRLAAGLAWQGNAPGEASMPVFATDVGSVYDRTNLDRALRSYLKKAGLLSRGPHALRHTFATNCVRAGVDLRTLAEILGHTNVAFTMQQYVHSDMTTKRAGMMAVEQGLKES